MSENINLSERITVDQLRNILMNEMGLSRDFIKKETHEITTKTCEKYLNNLLTTNRFNDIMYEIIDKQIRQEYRNNKNFSEYVRDAVNIAVKNWIDANVTIQPKINITQQSSIRPPDKFAEAVMEFTSGKDFR